MHLSFADGERSFLDSILREDVPELFSSDESEEEESDDEEEDDGEEELGSYHTVESRFNNDDEDYDADKSTSFQSSGVWF